MDDELTRNEMIAYLARPCGPKGEKKICLLGGTRKMNNPNSRIQEFLYSLITHTDNLEHIEIYFRIDDDDDLDYYYEVKQLYEDKLSLIFIVGPRLGYRKLYIMGDELARLASKNVFAFIGVTDDCLLLMSHWDTLLYEKVISYRSHDIFFVQTHESHPILGMENISKDEMDKEDLTYHWQLFLRGPTSCFWIIGRGVLEAAWHITRNMPEWGCYGNNLACDSYFDCVMRQLWLNTCDRHLIKLAPLFENQQEISLPEHKGKGSQYHNTTTFLAYYEFLKQETHDVIHMIGKELSNRLLKRVA